MLEEIRYFAVLPRSRAFASADARTMHSKETLVAERRCTDWKLTLSFTPVFSNQKSRFLAESVHFIIFVQSGIIDPAVLIDCCQTIKDDLSERRIAGTI